MKKIVVFLVSIFFITGCGNKAKLDMSKIKTNIDNLTSNEFDINQVVEKIESEELGYFDNLHYFYMSDLERINVDSNYVSQMLFRVKQTEEPAYIIIKPTDNNKEKLQEQLKNYLVSYSYEVNEYEDYLIYLFDDNKKEVLNQIKKTKKPLFSSSYEINTNNFKQTLGFELDGIDEYLISISIDSNVERYFIIKPKKNYKRIIKEKMKKYFEVLEEEWSSTDDVSLIKNHLEKEYGEYLIYVVSKDNDSVFKVIEDSKK